MEVPAAPWALVAMAIVWLCGYTCERNWTCSECNADIVIREAGLALRPDLVFPLGTTRSVTPDADLRGFVDPECRHPLCACGGDLRPAASPRIDVAARALWRALPDAPAPQRRRPLITRVNLSGVYSTITGTRYPGRYTRDELREFLRAFAESEQRKRADDDALWAHYAAFRTAMIQRPEFRAVVRTSLAGGDTSIEDVRWLLAVRDSPTIDRALDADERRRLNVARTLLAAAPSRPAQYATAR